MRRSDERSTASTESFNVLKGANMGGTVGILSKSLNTLRQVLDHDQGSKKQRRKRTPAAERTFVNTMKKMGSYNPPPRSRGGSSTQGSRVIAKDANLLRDINSTLSAARRSEKSHRSRAGSVLSASTMSGSFMDSVHPSDSASQVPSHVPTKFTF